MTLIKETQTDSIWGTFEFYCISAEFPHAEYLKKHIALGKEASPVSAPMYKELTRSFSAEMAASYG